jgi:hypothetical protein
VPAALAAATMSAIIQHTATTRPIFFDIFIVEILLLWFIPYRVIMQVNQEKR